MLSEAEQEAQLKAEEEQYRVKTFASDEPQQTVTTSSENQQ